jgi:phage terminase large subunit-like protein
MSLQRNGKRAPAELGVFVRFCANVLTLSSGKPFKLEPFQKRLLADYFGGSRETLVLLSKKNGKTTLLAALALYHLIRTRDAECVIGATSRDQATILYDQAVGFIDRSPDLRSRVVAKRGYRELRSLRDSGRVRVLAADVDTADGIIPTLALVDELHRARSAELYGVFRDGLGPRDGQMVAISVAGDHEGSPLGVMRTAARKLDTVERKDGYTYARSRDGGFAMHEWALDADDDRDDMRIVKRVNPASWQTLELLRERHDSPSMLSWQWARFACGVWTSADSWWITGDTWSSSGTDERIEPGEKIAIGFDGSRYGDATALVACRMSDGLLQPLGVWEAPGEGVDWEVPSGEVDAAIAATFETYDVVRGYFDPPLWQTEIDEWAREYGESVVLRYSTARTRMQAATERFRTDLAAGRVVHADDETLSAHVLAAQMKEARGGYWLTKSRPASPDKIDAAVAAVLAYEARADAIGAEPQKKPSGKLLAF